MSPLSPGIKLLLSKVCTQHNFQDSHPRLIAHNSRSGKSLFPDATAPIFKLAIAFHIPPKSRPLPSCFISIRLEAQKQPNNRALASFELASLFFLEHSLVSGTSEGKNVPRNYLRLFKLRSVTAGVLIFL
jgi:hypothetical protein